MKTVTFKITYDDKGGYKGHGEDISTLIQAGIETYMEIDLAGDKVIKENYTVELIENPKADFKKEVKEMLDEISKLSKYNSNHDQILDNFGDIENVVKRFKQKHYGKKK